MIRTFLLATTMTLTLGAIAQADGFEPGREPGYGGAAKFHRAIHHHRQRHVARRSYGRAFIGGAEPGRLTDNVNVPVYNVPPRRFP